MAIMVLHFCNWSHSFSSPPAFRLPSPFSVLHPLRLVVPLGDSQKDAGRRIGIKRRWSPWNGVDDIGGRKHYYKTAKYTNRKYVIIELHGLTILMIHMIS